MQTHTRSDVSYLIIGSGRLSRHLQHYFTLESIPFATWSRKDSVAQLTEAAAQASHVLFAVSDSAIESLYKAHEVFHNRTCVHFSGAMSSDFLPSAHPLMTFSHDLYDLETYRRIPFVLEEGRGSLPELLPGLSNPGYEIASSAKPLYHALCVLSGNFTTLLWEKVFADFSSKLELPKAVLLPYLEQTARNLAHAPDGVSVLTGPLARGDRKTIARHLNVLNQDPFRDVYEAFVSAHSLEARPDQHKGATT